MAATRGRILTAPKHGPEHGPIDFSGINRYQAMPFGRLPLRHRILIYNDFRQNFQLTHNQARKRKRDLCLESRGVRGSEFGVVPLRARNTVTNRCWRKPGDLAITL